MGGAMNSRIGIVLSIVILLPFPSIQTIFPAPPPSLTIGDYTLTGSVRITRVDFDYTYKAVITNTGPAVNDVQATLTSSDPNVAVIDGALSFGNVAAGATKASADTFTIRVNRLYQFDESRLSWAISYSAVNTPPVANAGPDQTVKTSQTVQLNGAGSSDADGNPLTYAWSFVSRPAGSTAALSNPIVVNPTFVADKFGTYVVQLVVNDGTVNSAPDDVVISTLNSAPVANAGPDQTVTTGQQVQLNGAGSSDVDGNPLTYSWTLISWPPGSSASLSNPNLVNPTFVADRFGTYVVQLVVNDGTVNSAPDMVSISTKNSAPVANAGPDQTVTTGQTVQLTGAGSSDVDGNALTFAWSFVSRPASSTATLSDPTLVNPIFVADKFGTYVIQLIVNDGTLNSLPDTVQISTVNSKPVAKAGPNQTVLVGATVTLDGSGSSDVDGDPLTYKWSFTSKPGGSSANLDDNAKVNPKFIVDKAGSYVIQLIVNDGTIDSNPSTVTITTSNTPPVANAGPDQPVVAGATVNLDGSGSTDVDGNPLTYAWSFVSRPAGSSAVLSDPTALKPTFIADRLGDFVVQLIVNDGFVNSAPDSTTISTTNSQPVAKAGPDQTVPLGGVVVLDGSASSDADGHALTYSWSLTSKPSDSSAGLSGANTVSPSFTADKPGTYVAQLIVNDGYVNSAPDTVSISTLNSRPVANAGLPQNVTAGTTVQLDGSGSSDPDGNPITYSWSLITKPGGSSAAISNPIIVNPTFGADLAGDYVAQLIVSDGVLNSVPATVAITASEKPASKITLTPSPGQMITRGTLTMTVTLDQLAGTGGRVIDLSKSSSLVTIPSNVTILAGQLYATFDVSSSIQTGDVDITASASGLTSSTSTVSVVARAFTLYSPLVGINRTVVGSITLAQPAPSGGISFAMSVANTTVATISPSIVTIAQGGSIGNFELSGGSSIAFTNITADGTAGGYGSKTLDITVTNRLIDVPGAQELALGQSVTFPILIAPDAAPAGGVVIGVTSSNPSLVEVLTPVVTVPEGSFQANATIRAAIGSKGSATITASNAGFAPDMMQVSVSANLNIVQTFSNFAEDKTDDLFIEIMSGGIPYATPTAVSVTLSSSNPACAAVASSINVAIGHSLGTATVSYGGTATLPCTCIVTATSSLFGADTVEITVGKTPDLGAMTITDPWYGAYRVGASLQGQLRVTLATGSHGGIKVQIKSSAPSIARVAPAATTPGEPVAEINVPNGQTYFDFYMQGVRGSVGDATITATSPRFTDGTTTIKVVQPVFRLYSLDSTTTTLSADDEFYAYAGILNTSGTGIWFWQPVSAAGALPVTFTSSVPSVGQMKKTGQAGASVTVDIPVNREYTSTTVASGGVAFDPLAAGSTIVAATAPGFNNAWSEASATVAISQPGMTLTDPWIGAYRVGSSLQAQMRLTLGGSSHGGVTVHIASGDGNVLRVAPDATTAGTASIDIFLADGTTYRDFYIQGVRSATGDVNVTATQALFTSAAVTVKVVQPVFRLYSLDTATTTLSADDEFYAYAGILNTSGTGIWTWQPVSAAGALPVTFTSSVPSVGQMKKTGQAGASVTVDIPVNREYTSTTVASGGVAFDPLAAGSTVVAATAPGFNNAWTQASATVSVSQPGMTLTDPWVGAYRVGSSLQAQMRLTLGGSSHGGVTVHIASGDGNVLRVAPDATTAGTASIDIFLANGTTYRDFYIQGVRSATGDVTVTATQALFTSGAVTAKVVQPVFRLYSLDTATTTLSADDEFYAYAGILNTSGTGIWTWQPVSAAGALPVTFTSSVPSVGQMKKTGQAGASVTVDIPVNREYTSTTVASGGAAFDPLAGGSTVVAATAPGFNNAWSEASATVAISQPGMTLTDPWLGAYRVGSSLQAQMRLTLGGSSHGGVTVHIESGNANVLRVAPDATTAGTASIDIFLADGTTYRDFYIQGVRSATGDVTVTATQALFTSAAVTVKVVQPVFRLYSLDTTTTTLSADDEFYAYAGILNTSGTGIWSWQPVSAAGALPVTFTSSVPSVGQMKKTGQAGASVTVDIPVNREYTSTAVASGGVAFDPLAAGSTVVAATAPGFNNAWTEASATVSVSQPGMTLTDPWAGAYRVGSSLQGQLRLTLGGSSHGGVTVRISSGDTYRLLVSPNSTTVGTAFIDLFIPDGSNYKDFYVQGVQAITGSVTVTASSVLFTDGTVVIQVVEPVFRIENLNASTTAAAADDEFWVRTGILNTSGTGIWFWQDVNASAPVQVLVTSSNPAAGKLRTAAQYGNEVTVEVPVNQQISRTTVATGGVALDALAAGTTIVKVTAIGFNNSWSEASVTVTIAP